MEEPITLESRGPLIAATLGHFYAVSTPGKSLDDFMHEFFIPMRTEASTSGAKYLEQFLSIQQADKAANLKLGPMLISCAYCVQALNALDTNRRELAWSYMAEANYWAGVVWASTGLEAARERTIKATRTDTGKKGFSARNEGFKKLKEEAFRLVREECPKEKGWPSRHQAANVITPAVLRFAETIGKKLSPDQACKTIYQWLINMPDAVSFFPKKGAGR